MIDFSLSQDVLQESHKSGYGPASRVNKLFAALHRDSNTPLGELPLKNKNKNKSAKTKVTKKPFKTMATKKYAEAISTGLKQRFVAIVFINSVKKTVHYGKFFGVLLYYNISSKAVVTIILCRNDDICFIEKYCSCEKKHVRRNEYCSYNINMTHYLLQYSQITVA